MMAMPGIERIVNYLPLLDILGTAGQPLPEQFADIAAAGYQVVINLAMPTSTNALSNEGQLVTEQGMKYIHIPVVWEAPTLEGLERFFQAMDRDWGRRIFVHCALNWRVSCFVMLYRVVRLGIPLEQALKAQRVIWEPDEVWTVFVNQALVRHGFG